MREKVLAAGGLFAALGASTCCVAPLVLAGLGLGGAVTSLGVLAPYQTAFRIAAIALLAAGFWLIYARGSVPAEGEACPPTPALGWAKPVLWTGAGLMALVLTSAWWERLLA